MKPKTKLHRHVMALSGTLRPVTEQHKSWANDSLFSSYYTTVRNRNFCLECGHKWNPCNPPLANKILDEICPQCQVTLKPVQHWDRYRIINLYWSKMEVCQGFQVIRMFYTNKYLRRECPAKYSHHEVIQHWIGQDGRITSLMVACQGFGTYHSDNWTVGSNLEVRTESERYRWLQGLDAQGILPGRKILPLIRRNGFKGRFHGLNPLYLFSALLRYPKAEILLKTGQINLLTKYLRGYDKEIEKFWRSICIATRHGYIVKEPGTWLDYLKLLAQFDRDLSSPHYICPKDVEKEHNRYVEKVRAVHRKRKLKEMKAEMDLVEPEFQEAKKRFFDLKITAGDMEIVPLKSVREFFVEGDKLCHCLFANGYHTKERSLILSARIKGEPVETVEVDLNRLAVTQARGMHNQPTESHQLIVQTVSDNMQMIAKKL